jgi:hypothetical protein
MKSSLQTISEIKLKKLAEDISSLLILLTNIVEAII